MTEDRTGADTEGPEATDEQDVFVRGLLASLRADDPAIPDHVAARLDAVLAEERRTAPVPLGTARALTDAEDASGTGSATDLDSFAPVTVLPTRSGGPSTRSFRVVLGLAAAAVVVVGGSALALQNLGSNGTSTSAGSLAAELDDSGRTVARSSGTAYTSTSLAAQAGALVLAARDSASGPVTASTGEASPLTPESVPGAGTPTPGATSLDATSRVFTSDTLEICVRALSEGTQTQAVAADRGTYDGKPVDVVVIRTPEGDPTKLDVWVLRPGCGADSVATITVRRIDAP